MPHYNNIGSDLKKMDYGHNNVRAGKRQFNISNIAGDPFSLATSGIAIAGWVVAFISSIIADINDPYPNYSWWSIVYMLFVILGVVFAVGCDCVPNYQVAIVGLLSAGLVFTTSSVNALIYNSDPAKEAAAAGFILLSMVSIAWIFYYGSSPTTSHRQTIDSFALHKEGGANRASRHMTQTYRPETMHSSSQPPQMYNSAQLAGFETSSPVTTFPSANVGAQGPAGNAFQQQASAPSNAPPASVPVSTTGLSTTETKVGSTEQYPYRAKAIYSYEANPDDANEISFTKHEILDVSDVSGRWWQAKKENGETGIAPSNYLILL